MEQQAAPPAADVEKPFAGAQPELPANQVELPLLRGVEVVAGTGA